VTFCKGADVEEGVPRMQVRLLTREKGGDPAYDFSVSTSLKLGISPACIGSEQTSSGEPKEKLKQKKHIPLMILQNKQVASDLMGC
jgi:hypothetical protein